jgi:hypothetical protein
MCMISAKNVMTCHSAQVIPLELTKWLIQFMHILSDIAFLIPTRFYFYDLFLHDIRLNFYTLPL